MGPVEDSGIRIKRLIYQAAHRGTREADLLIGTFVRENALKLSENDLVALEHLLTWADHDILTFLFSESTDHTPWHSIQKLLQA